MSDLVKKLLNFVATLLIKYLDKPEASVVDEPQDSNKIQNESAQAVANQDQPYATDQEKKTTLEPTETNTQGPGVTHCLWKPLSDTSPELVVVVAADTIRREHLFIEFFDKNGKPIGLKTNKSYSDHRGNKLSDHKLGRFNFKPGFKVEDLEKRAPISVQFFIKIDKQKYHCKVGGLDKFVVTDLTKRWVCSNGKVKADPK